MPINWVDFIYVGPPAIWFLGGTIFFAALLGFRNTRRMQYFSTQIQSELKNTADAITTATSEVSKAAVELRDDTCKLQQGNSGLRDEMIKTRTSIDSFNKTLQRWSYWFPNWMK